MAKPDDGGSARLEAVLAERGFADPRPALRERLRALRDGDPAAFERATARFEQVVRADQGTGDALEPWIEYGHFLGELTGEGRLYSIDPTGRGTTYEPPIRPGSMVLHMPDDVSAPALAVIMPAAPTAAQQATHDLVVGRKLGLA